MRKSKRLEGIITHPMLALSPAWEKEFLAPSMASSTMNAFDIISSLDHDGKLDEAPQKKKQKLATGLLRDKLCEQDFAGPISVRASKVLGPISRHRIADILPHMKLVSRASRLGLTVGILRILCNVLCTAQRFHTEDYEQTCRVGCPNEPDSLSPMCSCGACSMGSWVMGFIDAFVYAHHQHRRGVKNPGNFGDCMKGRIRFMIAITPA